MPLSRRAGRFSTRWTSPFMVRVTGRLPWHGTLRHVGRRSGRVRRTPLSVFRHGDMVAIPLAYSAEAGWVANVLAAEQCSMVTGGRTIHLTDARIVTDPTRHLVPRSVGLLLKLIRCDEFMTLRLVDVEGGTRDEHP